MDIFRGRYRDELRATRRAIPADKVEHYRFALPNVDHVFLPGHRIMVQIQSSWFPLYDRNPQTFVANIFFAKPGDYRKATQRVYPRSPARRARSSCRSRRKLSRRRRRGARAPRSSAGDTE